MSVLQDQLKSVTLVKAKVVNTDGDPLSLNRVQVYIPSYSEYIPDWNTRTDFPTWGFPWASWIGYRPSKGDTVYVSFEGGDVRVPVVVGLVNKDSSGGAGGDALYMYSGGSLAELAAQVIFRGEGNYQTVRGRGGTDNEANLSLGKLQWTGVRAYDLMEKIYDKIDKSYWNQQLSNFGETNNSQIKHLMNKDGRNTWNGYTFENGTLSGDEPNGRTSVYKFYWTILGTDTSKEAQDSLAVEDVKGYLDALMEKEITDAKMLIYLADIYNQSPAFALSAATGAKNAGKSNLDELHKWICDGNPSINYYINGQGTENNGYGKGRRNRVYDDIKQLEQDGKLVPSTLTNIEGANLGGKILNPVPGITCITSPYGYRTHPVTGLRNSFHNGIDLGAPGGHPIIAVAEGEVLISEEGYNGGWGNYIVIYHPSLNIKSLYAHGMDGSRKVEVGDRVSAGQQIMSVDSTGSSTGNHLHFTLVLGRDGSTGSSKTGPGDSFDPTPWINL